MQGNKRHLNDDYVHTTSKKQRIAKPIQDPSTSSSGIQQVKKRTNLLSNTPDTSKESISNGTKSTQLDLRKGSSLPMNPTAKSLEKKSENEQGLELKTESSSPIVASTTDIPEHIR